MTTTTDPDEELVRVVSSYFVAALIMRGDICVEAAPILAWAVGKSRADLRAIFAKRGFVASTRPCRPRLAIRWHADIRHRVTRA